MAIVTFRYWAAAKDAAGATEEQVAALTLAEALAQAGGSAPSAPVPPGSGPVRIPDRRRAGRYPGPGIGPARRSGGD
jgi:hypothetical protein